MMKRCRKWPLLSGLLATAALAQEKRPGGLGVQKYTIDAQINPRTQSIEATAKIDFTPLDNVTEASFELNNAFTVSQALACGGKPLTTSRNTQDFTIHVTFATAVNKGQACEFAFSFVGLLSGFVVSLVLGFLFAVLF